MNGYITYAEAATQLENLQNSLSADENINAVKQHLANNISAINELSQKGTFNALTQSTDDLLSVLVNDASREVRGVSNTAEYVSENYSTSAKEAIEQLYKGNSQSLPDVTHGASGMSSFLSSNQEQLNGHNQVDADYAVLSNLAYASKWGESKQYSRAIQKEGITVREYCEALLDTHDLDNKPLEKQFLEELSKSSRFSGLTVDHSIGSHQGEGSGGNTQVLVFGCDDGHAIMSIQGTNGTIVDWNTNTDMANGLPTAEDRWVSATIQYYGQNYQSIDITGHSQGGHEAIAAAILLDDESRAKIGKVYSNDGPGFSKEFKQLYHDKIEEMEERVTNIRGEAPKVGPIFTPIGKVINVSNLHVVSRYENGKPIYEDEHLSTTWYVKEDGSYVLAPVQGGSSLSVLIGLTEPINNFLSIIIPEERLEYYLHSFIELGGDENGNWGFENYFHNITEQLSEDPKGTAKTLQNIFNSFEQDFREGLDKIAEEELSDFSNGILMMSNTLADGLDNIDSIISKAIKGSKWLSKVFPNAAIPESFLNVFNMLVVPFKLSFRIITIPFYAVAYGRARKKKEERNDYIRRNDTINVATMPLSDAMVSLAAAIKNIRSALQSIDEMMRCFKGTIRSAVLDEFGKEETKEFLKYVPPIEARAYCRLKGVGITTGSITENLCSNLEKAVNVIQCVRDDSANILAYDNHSRVSNSFEVHPEALARAAADCSTKVSFIGEQIDNLKDCYIKLGKSWEGADYDRQMSAAANDMELEGECISALINYFETLENIAKTYSKYQETQIERFQSIKI